MLTIGNEEIRPAHRGELRVLVIPGGPGGPRPDGLRQVREYFTADLVRRYAERIKLAPSVIDLSPDGADGLRAACDALNIHPPRHTLARPVDADELRGLFTDGVREPVFDLGVRADDGTALPDGIKELAARWMTVPAEADGEGLEPGQEPLSVRLKLLGFDGDAAAGLSRWRRRVAEWANSPSGAMSRPHAEALEAAFADGLDTAAALRILAGLEADESVGDGVKFETFVAADRLLGLDLARDIGRY